MPIVDAPGVHTLRTRWQVKVQITDHPERAWSWIEDISTDLDIKPPDPRTPPILVDQASSDAVRKATNVELYGIRNFLKGQGQDVIIGCTHAASDELLIRSTHELFLGPNRAENLYPKNHAIFGIPVKEAELDDPIVIKLTAELILHREIDMGNFPPDEGQQQPFKFGNPDRRPRWYGPQVTITCNEIQWFDSLDEAPLSDHFRRHIPFFLRGLPKTDTADNEIPTRP
jgi:hypothetical protein